MKLNKFLPLLLFVLLFSIPSTLCDGAVFFPYLNIESAKIVSVGAYFYMDIRNIWTEKLDVKLGVIKYIEADYPDILYAEHDQVLMSWTDNVNRTWYHFTLYPDEIARFHFHAPTKLHHENDTCGVYPIEIVVDDVDTDPQYTNKFTFRVQVITLRTYEPDYWEHEKEIEWWKKEADYFRRLWEESYDHLPIGGGAYYYPPLEFTDYVLLSLLSLGIIVLGGTAYYIMKRKKSEVTT